MTDIFHDTGRLLRYMPQVQFRKQELRLVEVAWDNLSLLSSLSSLSSDASAGADLGRARQDFAALSNDMMRGLSSEGLHNALDNLGSKAQVCIDIMVRNLFERTADIGFFATDTVIASYLAQSEPQLRSQMEERLREYAQKYSVYVDIFLFDRQGSLQASLKPHPGLEQLTHAQDQAFLQAVQSSRAPYVEHYARHHFCADPDAAHTPTLLYAHQVVETDHNALGTLCLQFNMADEMPTIFNAIQDDKLSGDGVVLAVVNAEGVVIGSNDPLQAPNGWRFANANQCGTSTARHMGREYLMVVRDTHGFQGYGGPGWRGLAMLPLDMAFDDDAAQSQSPLMAEVARNTDLLAAELRSIPGQSAAIQATLERSVWNGLLNVNRLESDGSQQRDVAFARALLSEIGNTAHKTAQAFASALQDLHAVVIRSMLRDVQGRAALAMQILDRNLYERANDCRWWALTPQFAETLRHGTQGCAQASAVLAYINSLYTVYTSLVLFDAQGVVVAVSNPADAGQVGQVLDGGWVQQTLGLGSSQDYAVSTFAPSPFSADRPTFIYAAAVRDPDSASAAVLGGIAVVWDASSQLSSILADCGDEFSDRDLLAFVDTSGQLVAVHGDAALLNTPQAVALARSGERIVALGIGLYGVGTDRGSGYREFRAQDGYDHGIGCVVLRNLCPSRSAASGVQPVHRPIHQALRSDATTGRQMATFSVAGHWLCLPAEQVVQAAPDVKILGGRMSCPPFLGIAHVGAKAYPVIDLRGVIARHADGKTAPLPVTLAQDEARQLIVVQVAQGERLLELALRVDALGAIFEVDTRKLQDIGGQNGGAALVDAVVSIPTAQNGQAPSQAMLSRISQQWLLQCMSGLQKGFVPQDLAALTAGA